MPAAHEHMIIAFDAGTTAVKGAVYTLAGEQVFSQRVDCLHNYPRPGWVEQDPERWLDIIISIANTAAHQLHPDSIRAMGICSQVNTHLFINDQGAPLRKAIIWQDVRCAEVAAELQAHAASRGQAINVDASSLLSRAAWVAKYEPEVWRNTRWILSPKDYFVFSFTGEVVADALTSFELVNVMGNYDTAIISLVEGLAERLPPLKPITAVNGNCRHTRLPLRCPVVVGTMDAWASLYGSGAVNPGDGFQVSGTSEIIGLLSSQSMPTPGVLTFPPDARGIYLHGGPTQAGGDALTWFAGVLDETVETLLARAERPAAGEEPLVFLPYLMGERAPLWDATARGTFCGLSKRHTQNDMALAVLEGVGFSVRQLLEETEKAAGFQCSHLRLSGGSANSDIWSQIKANILERSLERVKNTDTGVFGVALMAMVGIGLYSDIYAAAQTAVKIERVFEPDTSRIGWYRELYATYRASYQALKPVFSRLAALQNEYAN